MTLSVPVGWSASAASAAARAASKASLASLARASQVALDACATVSISSGAACALEAHDRLDRVGPHEHAVDMRAKRLRHRVGGRQADAVVVVAEQGNQNHAHEDELLRPRNSGFYNSLARIPEGAVETGPKA